MYEFKLPDLGEGIHEGELLKWYVNEGDTINEDESLVEVETDKAAVTIPSPRAGRIVKINGSVGDVLEVGTVLVVIDDGAGVAAEGDAAAETKTPAAETPAPATETPKEAAVAPATTAARVKGPIPAAPATRRLARELGVNLADVPPTGPGGRVTREDVQAFVDGDGAARPPAREEETPGGSGFAGGHTPIPLLDLEPLPDFTEFGPVETEPLRSIRRKVARKMVTSMVLVPHVCHMDEADVTGLEASMKRERERLVDTGAALSLLAFVMKAVAVCLKKFPVFNASLDPFKGELIYKKYYNLGFAADTDRGLVVPVLKEVDRKNLVEISEGIRTLAAGARDGSIAVEDFRGGTFTVTNIGSLGGTGLAPTINYPEAAILGMGRMQEKPVVRDGEIVIRKMLPLSLAFDHRIADGADAARFMNELVQCLSDPVSLLVKV